MLKIKTYDLRTADCLMFRAYTFKTLFFFYILRFRSHQKKAPVTKTPTNNILTCILSFGDPPTPERSLFHVLDHPAGCMTTNGSTA